MKMFRKSIIIPVAMVMAVGVGLFGASAAFAAPPTLTDVADGTSTPTDFKGEGQPTTLFDGTDAIIPRVINLMLFVVGILAVIMLIYGGIRYVISGGSEKGVAAGKNTILYAIIGLIVAILGYAIVGWIVGNIGDSNGSQDVM
jgi:ABC-type Na+ efflux pump permease subunit